MIAWNINKYQDWLYFPFVTDAEKTVKYSRLNINTFKYEEINLFDLDYYNLDLSACGIEYSKYALNNYLFQISNVLLSNEECL